MKIHFSKGPLTAENVRKAEEMGGKLALTYLLDNGTVVFLTDEEGNMKVDSKNSEVEVQKIDLKTKEESEGLGAITLEEIYDRWDSNS